MIIDAKSAAQSSADSQPGPPIRAIEIPTNAAAEVIASERWCQASAATAWLPSSWAPRNTRRNRVSLMATTTTSTIKDGGERDMRGGGRSWCIGCAYLGDV